MAASPTSSYYRPEFLTKYIAVEGYTEKVIVDYLKNRFCSPPLVKVLPPDDLHGSTPHEIIIRAIKRTKNRDYYQKYIFMDTDKKIKKEDLDLAAENKFEFVYNHKCGEATILQLVKPNKDWTKSTSRCRLSFKKTIGSVNNIPEYLDKITITILKNHPTFGQLISILQKL